MFFSKEKRIIANEIKKNDDGTMEVTITFSPFRHGHDLGTPKNYDIEKYRNMVTNKSTQARIANGYAVGYYSHNSRNKHRGYIPSETNTDGKEVMPCCKTLKMEWVDGENKVRHTQRILNNTIGKEIQKLIEGGVGGFSSVHNLKTGEFFGFDYVVSPNFSSNRAVVDNICENGVCDISLDDVTTTLEKQVEDYLQEIGVDSISIKNALINLERHTDDFKAAKEALEKIEKAKYTLQDEIKLKDIQIEELQEEIERLREQLNKKEDRYKIELDSIFNELEEKFGINRDLEINETLDSIFKYTNYNEELSRQKSVLMDSVEKIKKDSEKEIKFKRNMFFK